MITVRIRIAHACVGLAIVISLMAGAGAIGAYSSSNPVAAQQPPRYTVDYDFDTVIALSLDYDVIDHATDVQVNGKHGTMVATHPWGNPRNQPVHRVDPFTGIDKYTLLVYVKTHMRDTTDPTIPIGVGTIQINGRKNGAQIKYPIYLEANHPDPNRPLEYGLSSPQS